MAAQNDDDDDVLDDQEWDKAIMQTNAFRPRAKFIITSPVLQWVPNAEDIRDNVWSEYNTRAIRYLGDPNRYFWWQAQEAEVPNFNQDAGYVVDAEGDTGPNNTPQPEVFRMRDESSLFGDEGFMTVNFTPVGEDEEDALLEQDDWWLDDEDEEDDVGLDDI